MDKKNFFFPREKAWRRKKIDKHNLVSFLFSHFVSFESDLLRVLPVDEREWRWKNAIEILLSKSREIKIFVRGFSA